MGPLGEDIFERSDSLHSVDRLVKSRFDSSMRQSWADVPSPEKKLQSSLSFKTRK